MTRTGKVGKFVFTIESSRNPARAEPRISLTAA